MSLAIRSSGQFTTISRFAQGWQGPQRPGMRAFGRCPRPNPDLVTTVIDNRRARPMRFRERERGLVIGEREAQANCRPFGSVRNVAPLGEPTEHERERALADAEREKHHEQSAAPPQAQAGAPQRPFATPGAA